MGVAQRISVVAVLAAFAAASVPPAQANVAAGDALSRRIATQRQALDQAKARAAQAEREGARLAAQSARLREAARAERMAAAALALRIQAAEQAVAASAARVALADALRERQLVTLRQRQGPVLALLARLQHLSRRPPISLLAEPGTAQELVHTRIMLSALLPTIRQQTARLRGAIAESRRLAELQRAARARHAQDRDQLAARRTELNRQARQQQSRATQLGARASLEADMAQVLADRAQSLDVMMATIDRAAGRRDRLIRLDGPTPRPGSAPAGLAGRLFGSGEQASRPAGQPRLIPPVIGDVRTGFGALGEDGLRSRGISVSALPGAQIVAPADGRVMFAGPFRSYGDVVITDHGAGWTSLITGLISLDVRVGDEVGQGNAIGRAGPGTRPIGVELRHHGEPVSLVALFD